MTGYAPSLSVGSKPRPINERETKKLEAIWSFEKYKSKSFNPELVDIFWRMCRPTSGMTVIDFGAGVGQYTRILKDKHLNASGFEWTNEPWEAGDIHVQMGVVWRDRPWVRDADFAFCCNMLERTPPELVGLSIARILETCRQAFFAVSFVQDNRGADIGEPVQLTVMPFAWWRDLFREIGTVVEARDLIDSGVFLVSAP